MDIADEGQQAEALFLAGAIAAARAAPAGAQVIVNGQVVCADCGQPIPAKRIAAVPGATRCRDCQEAAEG
ncbi:MAG: TraR/DksA C4-type zinc finger protein [Desulfovibrionaceae bacterium]